MACFAWAGSVACTPDVGLETNANPTGPQKQCASFGSLSEIETKLPTLWLTQRWAINSKSYLKAPLRGNFAEFNPTESHCTIRNDEEWWCNMDTRPAQTFILFIFQGFQGCSCLQILAPRAGRENLLSTSRREIVGIQREGNWQAEISWSWS